MKLTTPFHYLAYLLNLRRFVLQQFRIAVRLGNPVAAATAIVNRAECDWLIGVFGVRV